MVSSVIAFSPAFPVRRATNCKRTTRLRCSASPTSPLRTPRRFTIPFLTPIIDILFTTEHTPSPSTHLGPIYHSRVLLNRPAVVLADLHAIATVYRNPKLFISGNGGYPSTFADMLGTDSLLLIDGPPHASKRAKVLDAFVPAAMHAYYGEVRRFSRVAWEGVASIVTHRGRCSLDDFVRGHLLEVVIRLTGGACVAGREAELKQLFLQIVRGLDSVPFTPPHRRGLRARVLLTEALSEVIESRRAEASAFVQRMGNADKARKRMVQRGEIDLITLLCLDAQHGANVAELARLVMLIWFAGYTTQASAISCAVAKMTDDVKTRLVAEQMEVSELLGENIGLEDWRKGCMPLLDAYMDEVMRLYPPVANMFRKAVSTTTVLGYTIEAGTPVLLDLWTAMRSEKLFRNPLQLDIERHLADDGDGKKFPGWAFGVPGGPHFCLGQAIAKMQMTCLMSEMLRNWEVELAPNQNLTVRLFPEVKPIGGCVIVKCRRRANGSLQ